MPVTQPLLLFDNCVSSLVFQQFKGGTALTGSIKYIYMFPSHSS